MITDLLKLTGVLVALKHELSLAGGRVPELHATVLASGHDPLAIRCEGNAEDKVSVALESLDTLATLGVVASAAVHAGIVELPHLDGLVQRTRHKVATVRRERNTVDTIVVSLLALGALDQDAGLAVPNADTLVQATSSDVTGVRRNRNGGDTILDRELQDALVLLKVPQPDGTVSGA